MPSSQHQQRIAKKRNDGPRYHRSCELYHSLLSFFIFTWLNGNGGKNKRSSSLSQIFQQARTHYDRLKMNASHVDTLSMGMSHDMVTAIESGATMVRIGTAIFGERPS
ncbi:MAG: alanine racemase [Gammaproteobacteria bacterium]|nr:alanine racemase [Gammaproteobacteria bacterium]